MTLPLFPEAIRGDSYVPLRVQVYSALREAIVGGRLRPGERIVEDRVCAELGVSRSPLREALRRLEGEGLVTILPRRGAVVTELSEGDGMELFAVREALEGLSASLAARRITAEELAELEDVCLAMEKCIQAKDVAAVVQLNTQFHELISAASRNRWTREFLSSIKAQIRRAYRSSLEVSARAPESLAEHRLILNALRCADPQQAEVLARQHVRRARDAALSAGVTTS